MQRWRETPEISIYQPDWMFRLTTKINKEKKISNPISKIVILITIFIPKSMKHITAEDIAKLMKKTGPKMSVNRPK